MRRDSLWLSGVPQLEFVVDNTAAAGLANIELSISNPLYESAVHSIRLGLRKVFSDLFRPKGGFLNPVEWRPREFNAPPDTVCNWVLAAGADMTDLDLNLGVDAVVANKSLQIHCDGGYAQSVGAAAFVVHVFDPATGLMDRIGYVGIFMEQARSAFHAEITALDSAQKWVQQLRERWLATSLR